MTLSTRSADGQFRGSPRAQKANSFARRIVSPICLSLCGAQTKAPPQQFRRVARWSSARETHLLSLRIERTACANFANLCVS